MSPNNPSHVAIILDGNRRFAKKQKLKFWKGHEAGVKKVEDLFAWCSILKIKELTLYCFSTENFSRPKGEREFLFKLFLSAFNNRHFRKLISKNKIRVNVIGRIRMFPEKIQAAMKDIMDSTKQNKKFIVNFAMAYGGRQELTDAFRSIVDDVINKKIRPEQIDEKLIAEKLYLKNEPDMLIRPGGEMRISNFLIWQSSYSELFFVDKLWPEFTKKDLIDCIEEFKKRERRFGK